MKKSLDQGFDMFLNWLDPLNSEHEKAIKHKESVNRCLSNKFDCYEFYETGSFGNGTGVRHYSDTDYFATIPSKYLKTNSSISLREVKEAIQSTFYSTNGIEVKCPSVRIPFGNYQSERMEITPCYFQKLIETPLGKFGSYGIPNCDSSWMSSSPKAHNAYVKKYDEKLYRKLKPLIRLVKAWKFYNKVPIMSFYLELRTTKYAEGESAIIYNIDLKRIFNQLYDIELASIKDPMGVSGLIAACKSDTQKEECLSKIKSAAIRAMKAEEAKENGNIDDAFYWWNLLFNYKFPSR